MECFGNKNPQLHKAGGTLPAMPSTRRKTELMKYLLLCFLAFTITGCSQNNRTILGKNYAEKELKEVLTNNANHNIVDNKELIIKDSLTATNVAESILFKIYGKNNIESQKPYETYLIEKYWVISGTLPKGYDGGTFLIIIDARNSQVLKITHGK